MKINSIYERFFMKMKFYLERRMGREIGLLINNNIPPLILEFGFDIPHCSNF